MKNFLNDTNSYEKPKQEKNKTLKHITKFSWLAWLILSINANALENNTHEFDNTQDSQRYEQIIDEFSFSQKWFIQTIQEKNPELLSNKQLIRHERKILRLFRLRNENWILNNTFKLTKENIDEFLNPSMESFIFLMDTMYWEWYSKVLTDWLEHENKVLIIDFKKDWNEYKIRKLGIETIENDKEQNKNFNTKKTSLA